MYQVVSLLVSDWHPRLQDDQYMVIFGSGMSTHMQYCLSPTPKDQGSKSRFFWAHDCRAIVCDIRQRLGNKICTKIVPEKGLEFQNDFEPCVAHTKEYEDIMDTGSVYEIHFRFQPNLKKLLVSMVRSQWNSLTALKFLACFNLEFQKGEEYSYDIQENIDYFPFVQGHKSSKVTLFKPRED